MANQYATYAGVYRVCKMRAYHPAALDWLLVARTLDAIKAAALLGLGRWAEIEHHGPDGDPRHGSVPTHEIARLHLHVLPAGAKASVRSHHCTFVCARV